MTKTRTDFSRFHHRAFVNECFCPLEATNPSRNLIVSDGWKFVLRIAWLCGLSNNVYLDRQTSSSLD